MAEPQEILDGVFLFRAKQWVTNCLALSKEGRSLVVDPAWTAAEVKAIRKFADAKNSSGGPLEFVLTHADCDHVCGMDQFQDATITVEKVSAKLIDDKAAATQLNGAGNDWGVKFDLTHIRYDKTFVAGDEIEAGPWRIQTVDAHGHMLDGAALYFADERILVPGDYICSSMTPLAWWSVTHSRATLDRLIALLEENDVRLVVPGHGAVLPRLDALALAREDRDYFASMEEVARRAKEKNQSWADAMTGLMDVPEPRRSDADIALYAPHVMNAKQLLVDVGLIRPGEQSSGYASA